MTTGAGRVVVVLLITCALLGAATIALLMLGTQASTPGDEFGLTGIGGLSFLAAFLIYATVGGLIVLGVPDNPIGPLFCTIGVLGTVGTFAYEYADYTIYVSPDALPGGAISAWVQNLIPPVFGMLALSLLLFPDGRLPSPRWRGVVGLTCAGIACSVVGYTLKPGPIEFPFEAVSNPIDIGGPEAPFVVLSSAGWLLMTGANALAGFAIAAHLRRSRGARREQLKWIALAGAAGGLALVVNAASRFLSVPGIGTLQIAGVGVAFAVVPIAAGVAILRYRLYDIDLVINRALVYSALSATLAGTYLGTVLLLQLVLSGFTAGGGLAVAASTITVAALFQPVRRRIQARVDRRFFRSKYDAARTLERFGARLRDEVELDALGTDLRAVVVETMQPTHVTLWLRVPEASPVTLSGRRPSRTSER